MDANFEGKIEQQCNIITRTETEFWEGRNKALLALTQILSTCEGTDPTTLIDFFSANTFRLLKEALKSTVTLIHVRF